MIPALYTWLKANSGIPNWYQYGLTGISPNTPKPYGIIELGPLLPSASNQTAGIQVVELTVVYPRLSWVPVDQTCERLRTMLNQMVLVRSTGERFRMEWAQTPQGDVDSDLDAFVRTVIFQVFTAL